MSQVERPFERRTVGSAGSGCRPGDAQLDAESEYCNRVDESLEDPVHFVLGPVTVPCIRRPRR